MQDTSARRLPRRSALLGAVACAALLIGSLAIHRTPSIAQSAAAPPELTAKAREIAQTYLTTLKTELADILEDGPASAWDEYVTTLIDTGTTATEQSSFDLARVSATPRAPEHAPDAWEAQALDMFKARIAAGADPSTLEVSAVTTTSEGTRIFRYMRPVVAEAQCLACHGKDVSDEIKAKIVAEYPADKSIGFAVGDLMGGISMVQPME
jgi:hypothetical protein